MFYLKFLQSTGVSDIFIRMAFHGLYPVLRQNLFRLEQNFLVFEINKSNSVMAKIVSLANYIPYRWQFIAANDGVQIVRRIGFVVKDSVHTWERSYAALRKKNHF